MKKLASLIVILTIILFTNAVEAQSARLRFLCTDNREKPFFTLQPQNSNCKSSFLEEEWSNISFSPELIVDYNPFDIVTENDGIKIWSQFSFAEPLTTTHGEKYDGIKTLIKFYCGKRLQNSIRTIFYLNGKVSFEESFGFQEIEPSTISDALYKKACKKNDISSENSRKLRKLPPNESLTLDNGTAVKSDGATGLFGDTIPPIQSGSLWPLFLFTILQIIFIHVNWWAYNAYYIQPRHKHPALFWHPLIRKLFLTIPWLGVLGVVVSAFVFTDHPWLFLLFSATWWLLIGYRKYSSLWNFKPNPMEFPSNKEDESHHNPDAINAGIEIKPQQEKPQPTKEWLVDSIAYEDLISGAIYQFKEDARYWMIPASADESAEWINFQKNIQPGDEIWTFSSTITKVKSPFHWAGICLIREGVIVDYVIDELHINYRQP